MVEKWQGEVKGTREMLNPTWFDIKSFPWKRMMPADKKRLSAALNDKKVKARPKLGPFQKNLLEDFEIEEVDSFND